MNDSIYLREEMILGSDCIDLLKHSHVKVFGIGGVGSYAAEALARAGVGKISLIDEDTVSETNLNRQLCALHSTVGLYKSDVMCNRIHDINPNCEVVSLPLRYDSSSSNVFFEDQCDYIIDAIDLVSCKIHLIIEAQNHGIPIISAMGTGNKIDPTKFRITDISKTRNCRLARVIRKELRNREILHHTVLYSEELPMEASQPAEPLPPGRRSIPGSLSWVPSCAGLMLAGYVILKLCSEKNELIKSLSGKKDFFS